jgi:hypothetical protein
MVQLIQTYTPAISAILLAYVATLVSGNSWAVHPIRLATVAAALSNAVIFWEAVR